MSLPAWTGEVSRVLPGREREILCELIAVVEAVAEREHALTRAGIPPKPLWSAINERMLWPDPEQLLQDWDECDQIRLLFSLAEELQLVEADAEGVLRTGPGADRFFTAAPPVRARMFLRAWKGVVDWDERCDARDEEGYRYNFGRTFRRDFLRSPQEVREVLADTLAEAPLDTFVHVDAFAALVSRRDPALLISEEHEAPHVPEGEAEPEVRRLVGWWLFQAARFGWVDIARVPDPTLDALDARLFRLRPEGLATLRGEVTPPPAPPGERPFVLQPTGDIVVIRQLCDIGDEYLVRRVAEERPVGGWDEPAMTCRLSAESVRRAIDAGLDPALFRTRILERSSTPVPDTIALFFREALRETGQCSLCRGLSAVEVAAGEDASLEALREAGFPTWGRLVLIPWDRWEEAVRCLGEEPAEGFRYPSDVPLARAKGERISLEYPVLPLAGRDLLEAAGFDAEVQDLPFDDAMLKRLAAAGFPREAVARTLRTLVEGKLPKGLQS